MRTIIQFMIFSIATLLLFACMQEDPPYFTHKPTVSQDEEGLEYQLVWNEEFDEGRDANGRCALPGDKWMFEIGGHGWGNNEEQYYVDRVLGSDTVAKIKDGVLIISAIKLNAPYEGRKYISARMNTKEYWTYGRFEMRAKLPSTMPRYHAPM